MACVGVASARPCGYRTSVDHYRLRGYLSTSNKEMRPNSWAATVLSNIPGLKSIARLGPPFDLACIRPGTLFAGWPCEPSDIFHECLDFQQIFFHLRHRTSGHSH